MPQNIIDVDHLSIRFNLGNIKVDNLKEFTIRRIKHELTFQEFLALKDVDLHVQRGEAWGLIGTNGSGKSTLLKAITGILKPYKGTIKVRGRIAPMIELGAGFDQELTARENIFLNGAVLGYSRKFMEEHFDEIVEFAELQRFLDSPIKNYSSGMKARLGFAVATMVAPEILICDEVLSVGDASFRKRCNARMERMLSGGTTLLYVSHDINSVVKLCDHVLWLDHGEVVMQGDPSVVCSAYLERQDKVYSYARKKKEDREIVESTKKFDYLVVGAGLFGSVFADQAKKAGKSAVVIDRRDHIGGNIYTERIDGIDVHRYGAHIFHTSDARIWRYINRYCKFNRFVNSPVARTGSELYNLPFNMNTFSKMWGVFTPEEAQAKIDEQKSEYIAGRLEERRKAGEHILMPDELEALAAARAAEAAAAAGTDAAAGAGAATADLLKAAGLPDNAIVTDEGIFIPQNLEEQAIALVGTDIYEKLVKHYTEKQWGRPCSELPAFIIRRLPLRFTYDNNYFNDPWQGIPVGGYTQIIESMLSGVPVLTGMDYKTFAAKYPGKFRKVIYTGPIDEYFDYQFGHLQYRTVRFETERLLKPNFQGNAVVNYTGPEVPWTRIIEHKWFEYGKDLEGQDIPTTVISREYSEEWKPGMEPYYPVNDDANSKLYEKYLELAKEKKNVTFAGRLGTYSYYNMDQVILQAWKLAKKELKTHDGAMKEAVAESE